MVDKLTTAKPEFVRLPNIYGAKFTSPRIDVLEDASVNALEVRRVKSPNDRVEAQLRNPIGRGNGLELLEPVRIFDSG